MTTPLAPPTPITESLHNELRTLIAASRQRLAGTVNAELTRLYWAVGERLRREVLGGERAAYGSKVIDHLGVRLAAEFGRGFEAKNLRRMVKFAELFPDAEIVASVMRQLSWTHVLQLLPLKNPLARAFYVRRSATETWSVRELRRRIELKPFERTALASCEIPPDPPFAKGGVGMWSLGARTTNKQTIAAIPPFAKGGLGGIYHDSATAREVEI